MPEPALIPVAARGSDSADFAAVNAAHRFPVVVFVAPLGAGHHRQPPAIGFLEILQNHANAGTVHPNGLFGEHMLAGGNGGMDVSWAEPWRRRQSYQVAILDDPFIGVQADELPGRRDIDVLPDGVIVSQTIQAALQAIAEGIAHGGEADIGSAAEALRGGFGTAAAAADQADADHVRPIGMNIGHQAAGHGRAAGHNRRGLQKIPPRARVLVTHDCSFDGNRSARRRVFEPSWFFSELCSRQLTLWYAQAMIKHVVAGLAGLFTTLTAFGLCADPPLERFEFSAPHMGTLFRIVLYAKDESSAKKAVKEAFARIAELDGIMSDYRPA